MKPLWRMLGASEFPIILLVFVLAGLSFPFLSDSLATQTGTSYAFIMVVWLITIGILFLVSLAYRRHERDHNED